MKRHSITAAILLAALVLYGLGMTSLGIAAFIAGGIFELWFWIRLFSPKDATGANRISE